MRITTELLLELSNGVWAVCALALALLCVAYLRHEMLARQACWAKTHLHWRKRMTRGMRVATAVLAISVGIFIRTTLVFFWRFTDGSLADLNQNLLLLGTMVGVAGFLCAIREMSTLFSNVPWLLTLLAAAVFLVLDLFSRFG